MKLGKKKNCSKQIESIKEVIEQIRQMVADPNLTEEDYIVKGRIVLNMAIIQALIGAEVQKPKKEGKEYRLKFNHKLPSRTELAEIVELLNNEFIAKIENPFLDSLYPDHEVNTAAEGADDDDMEIVEDTGFSTTYSNVPTVEKWNGKKLKDYIFGYDGKSAMSKAFLTGIDCMKIAAIAEDVRKKSKRNRMLIIGGIALVITGGVVAGIVIHEHNKKDDADIDDMIDDIDDIDIDDVDVDDIEDIEIEDVPEVKID